VLTVQNGSEFVMKRVYLSVCVQTRPTTALKRLGPSVNSPTPLSVVYSTQIIYNYTWIRNLSKRRSRYSI